MTAPNTQQGDPILDRAHQLRRAGASIEEVKQYLHAKGYDSGDTSAEQPGVLSRGLSKAGVGLANTVMDLPGTVAGMINGPVESAVNIVAPNKEGAARYNADQGAQARNIARFGGELHAQGVTGKERAAGIAQTVANVAAPGIFRGVRSLAAPALGKTLAAGAGLSAAGAVGGAAYNPDDPGAGAIAGAVATPIVGGVTAGVMKGAGKIADLNTKRLQVKNAPTLGRDAVNRAADIKAVDAENYGQAAREGEKAGGTTPPLEAALDHPRVKDYADMFRNSDAGQGADDATVGRETYKLMSQEMKGLKMRMDRDGFDAKASLQIGDLKAAMKALKAATAEASARVVPPKMSAETPATEGPVTEGPLAENTSPPSDPTLRQALRDFPESALPPRMQGPGGPAFQLRGQPPVELSPGRTVTTPAAMPSFPGAVAEHASRERAMELSQQGADASKRVMYDRSLPGKKQATQSKEAILERIGNMDATDANSYQTGVLGRGKEGVKFHAPNATSSSKLANIVQPLTRLNRLAPVIDALDQRQGRGPTTGRKIMNPQTTEQLFRLLGLTLPSELTSSNP